MRSDSTNLSLRSRIIRAGSWTLGGHFASQFLRLASNLIMTRLLAPEWFGIMALANVIMVGLNMFSDLGLVQGIIHSRRGHEPVYLNTAWTVQILRGIGIWLIASGVGVGVYLLASWQQLPADSVYAAPFLPYVIVALSFNALIDGFASTRLAVANRNLILGRMILVELASQLIGLAFMIGCALVVRSIWALVAGSLVSTLSRVVFSHMFFPGEKNVVQWDRNAFSEIFGFGKWIFLTSILGFLGTSGDRLVLGALADPTTLGIYSIAFFLVDAFRMIFAKVASSVAFPALSEVARDRPHELKRVYYKFRLPVDAVALVAMGGLLAAGSSLIEILYDDRYSRAGWMVGILGILLFEARYSITRQCYLALGKPKLLVPTKALDILFIFGLVPFAYHLYGIDGAIWAVPVSALLTLPLTFYLKVTNSLFDIGRELIVLPFVGIGYFLGYAFKEMASWFGLAT